MLVRAGVPVGLSRERGAQMQNPIASATHSVAFWSLPARPSDVCRAALCSQQRVCVTPDRPPSPQVVGVRPQTSACRHIFMCWTAGVHGEEDFLRLVVGRLSRTRSRNSRQVSRPTTTPQQPRNSFATPLRRPRCSALTLASPRLRTLSVGVFWTRWGSCDCSAV